MTKGSKKKEANMGEVLLVGLIDLLQATWRESFILHPYRIHIVSTVATQ